MKLTQRSMDLHDGAGVGNYKLCSDTNSDVLHYYIRKQTGFLPYLTPRMWAEISANIVFQTKLFSKKLSTNYDFVKLRVSLNRIQRF